MFEKERAIREKILNLFPEIKKMSSQTTCKRKGVGCAILEIIDGKVADTTFAINGHSGDGTGNICQNIVGACGCAHAEPRAIMECLKALNIKDNNIYKRRILLSTYSACVNCANIIIDSGIIDAVAYEIHAEYWDEPPRNASNIIIAGIPLWTKGQIMDDIYGEKTIRTIL